MAAFVAVAACSGGTGTPEDVSESEGGSCRTDRQCPGQVCDLTTGTCVDCVDDRDCPTSGDECDPATFVDRCGPCCPPHENGCGGYNYYCDRGTRHIVEAHCDPCDWGRDADAEAAADTDDGEVSEADALPALDALATPDPAALGGGGPALEPPSQPARARAQTARPVGTARVRMARGIAHSDGGKQPRGRARGGGTSRRRAVPR